jgi:hypothetical protein
MKRLAIVALLALQGCCISPGFVETQRKFYDKVAPRFRSYIQGDASLDDGIRSDLLMLLEAEDAALREAEASQ